MTEASDDIITLRSGPTGLQVCPAAGGAITRYWQEQDDLIREWLWPATAEAIASRNPAGMSCFPLVPFSNRIREGRFRFRGRTVQLPLNFLPQRHTIHGHGWQAPWHVIETSQETLVIEYFHGADAWPYPYRARQRFDLSSTALTVTVELSNAGQEPMPAGIGLHPYFVRTPQIRVVATTDQMWLNDDEMLPVDLIDPPQDRQLSAGIRIDAVDLDNAFTAWSGRALVQWPEWHAQLTLAARNPLSFLVVYSPPGEKFFCVEPVSNCTDAFNLAEQGRSDTGMMVLAPKESAQGTVTFTPEIQS